MSMERNIPTEGRYLTEIESLRGKTSSFVLPDGIEGRYRLLCRSREGPKGAIPSVSNSLIARRIARINDLLAETKSLVCKACPTQKANADQGKIGSCAARAPWGRFIKYKESQVTRNSCSDPRTL